MKNIHKLKLGLLIGVLLFIPIAAIAQPNDINKPNAKVADTTYGSSNWAGYVVLNGAPYTSASGVWTVPTIKTTNSGYSSSWVGVGGFNGNTVIQIGTDQDCTSSTTVAAPGEKKFHGPVVASSNSNSNVKSNKPRPTACTPNYYAWWELYPENAEQRITTDSNGLSFNVHPTDSMSASVALTGSNTWTLTITDTTTGQTFSTTQVPTFTPDQGSAEGIMERPALCSIFRCTLTNLANFGTINLNSVSANNVAFDSTANGIIMIDNSGSYMATPNPIPISTPGTFTVNFLRSS
jgi:hypothetical protein